MACTLCGSPCDAPLLLGDMFQRRGVRCHHYCMLFSRDLPQRGKDTEGLQGFKLADIRQYAKKCLKRKCQYCRRGGAHAMCSHIDCTKRFHIPCAVYAGALLSFFGSFNVHCPEHRPVQLVDPEKVRDEPCGICLCPTGVLKGPNVLRTPCCGHNFHRLCLQKMALSSGYFFTCPICRDKNNRTGFLRHMKKFGVFVPQRDASWETEPNAFSELLEHHSGCDQLYCLSARGRTHMVKDHSDWGQLLCHSCASFGSHRLCAGRPRRLPWYCPDCADAFTNRRTLPSTERRPTLRQLLLSEQRPATALTMSAILAPEGGAPQWQRAMTLVDDPRQLLRFTCSRVERTVKIATRAVQDPKNPGHVLMPVRLEHAEWQLGPRVVLSSADRCRADQALIRRGCAAVAAAASSKRKTGAGRAAATLGRGQQRTPAPSPAAEGLEERPAADSEPPAVPAGVLPNRRRAGRPRKRRVFRGYVKAKIISAKTDGDDTVPSPISVSAPPARLENQPAGVSKPPVVPAVVSPPQAKKRRPGRPCKRRGGVFPFFRPEGRNVCQKPPES